MKREPKSEVGRATKKAILEAATQIIFKDGIERLNTNLVAEKAGVSVGSLYQYYENKDEILRDLLKSSFERRVQRLKKALDLSMVFSRTEEIVATVVDSLFEEEAGREAQLEMLLFPLIVASKMDWSEQIFYINDTIKPAVKVLLLIKEPSLKGRDLDTVSFVLMQAIRGTLLGMTMPFGNSLKIDTVKAELRTLILSYIRAG